MSSATTLIAVDLGQLQDAVGSKDDSLLQRAIEQAGSANVKQSWPIVLVFLKEGGVLLNDVRVTPEKLKDELEKPEHHGIKLYCIELRTGTPQANKAIAGAYIDIITGAMKAETVVGWQWEVPADEEFHEELSLEQAVAELINGKLTVRDEDWTHQYGYGLESIARVVGQHLATIEGDLLLSDLKLKTPISRRRKPVKMPRSDDVPEIGYLTAEEVRQEHARLQSMDLAFPGSTEIEESRREYATAVARAAAMGNAIVAFGY